MHPDQAEDCAKLFESGATFSHLATQDGDLIKIELAASNVAESAVAETALAAVQEDFEESDSELEDEDESIDSKNDASVGDNANVSSGSARSIVHVNVTIDLSLDTEKLEKQLALLRKYGAL